MGASDATSGVRRGAAAAILALVAACGGDEASTDAPPTQQAAARAPEPARDAPVSDAGKGGRGEAPAAADEAELAWSPPKGFRVLVPRSPGEMLPRVLQHRASGIELVLVPSGAFQLGSTPADPGHASDETPARRVEVAAFYLARTETTLAQWRAAGGERGRGEGDDHPIGEVSWEQVRAWCDANGLELPTEAQWEYAASGPDDRVFPWGDEANDIAVNALGSNVGDRWDRTAPVGSLPDGRSWCGLLDMAGNVAEWCRDPWTPDHASAPDDAKRVIRGGSYTCRPPWCLRTAYRDGIERELQSPNLGFRAALEVL
jgi:formylglycine-generating enzyme required for sulfatase activity